MKTIRELIAVRSPLEFLKMVVLSATKLKKFVQQQKPLTVIRKELDMTYSSVQEQKLKFHIAKAKWCIEESKHNHDMRISWLNFAEMHLKKAEKVFTLCK
jgi:hypothetical protein